MKLLGEKLVEATSTSVKRVDLLSVNDLDIPANTMFYVGCEVASDGQEPVEVCLRINEQDVLHSSGRALVAAGYFAAGTRVKTVSITGRTTNPMYSVRARCLRVYLVDDV